jgi:hypothetical protein
VSLTAAAGRATARIPWVDSKVDSGSHLEAASKSPQKRRIYAGFERIGMWLPAGVASQDFRLRVAERRAIAASIRFVPGRTRDFKGLAAIRVELGIYSGVPVRYPLHADVDDWLPIEGFHFFRRYVMKRLYLRAMTADS